MDKIFLNSQDYRDFKRELGKALLACTEEHYQCHITRAKFYGYLLWRNVYYNEANLLQEAITEVVSLRSRRIRPEDKMRLFNNLFSRIRYRLDQAYLFN